MATLDSLTTSMIHHSTGDSNYAPHSSHVLIHLCLYGIQQQLNEWNHSIIITNTHFVSKYLVPRPTTRSQQLRTTKVKTKLSRVVG